MTYHASYGVERSVSVDYKPLIIIGSNSHTDINGQNNTI